MAKSRKRARKRTAKRQVRSTTRKTARKAKRSKVRRRKTKPGLLSSAMQAMRDAGKLRSRMRGPHQLEDE